MNRVRKTVDLKKLVDRYNELLAMETVSRKEKSLISVLIEEVLMDTNNYQGFRFLSDAHSPDDDDYYDRQYFFK